MGSPQVTKTLWRAPCSATTPPWWLRVTWAARLKFGKWKPKRRSGPLKSGIWRWGLLNVCVTCASVSICVLLGQKEFMRRDDRSSWEFVVMWGEVGDQTFSSCSATAAELHFNNGDNSTICSLAAGNEKEIIRVCKVAVSTCYLLSGWSGIPARRCCSRERTTAACGCGRSLEETVKPSRVLEARPPAAKSCLTVRDYFRLYLYDKNAVWLFDFSQFNKVIQHVVYFKVKCLYPLFSSR